MNKLIKVSIGLSCLSVLLTFWINGCIANDYIHADGKTRALFGINELLSYGYQYWVVILGLSGLALSLTARRESRFKVFALLFSVLSIVLVFVRLWRLFV
jgi:hypothetical protein